MNMKIKEGDLITEGGISYVVEKDEEKVNVFNGCVIVVTNISHFP